MKKLELKIKPLQENEKGQLKRGFASISSLHKKSNKPKNRCLNYNCFCGEQTKQLLNLKLLQYGI